MKNLIVFTVIIVLAGIFVYLMFDDDENKIIASKDSVIEVIKPPVVTSEDDRKSDTNVSRDLNERLNADRKKLSVRTSEEDMQAMKKELEALHTNKNVTFESLGEVLEKYKNIKYNSQATGSNLKRIQHNLVIARKISNLTQKLHHDKDGKKELNEQVMKEIIELQKQLIIQTSFPNTQAKQ